MPLPRLLCRAPDPGTYLGVSYICVDLQTVYISSAGELSLAEVTLRWKMRGPLLLFLALVGVGGELMKCALTSFPPYRDHQRPGPAGSEVLARQRQEIATENGR